MRHRCLLLAVAFLAAAVPVARTDDKPALAEGNWVLATLSPLGESGTVLLKSETTDGKLVLTALESPPQIESTITDVKTDKGLSFKLKTVQSFKNPQTGKDQKFVNEQVFVAAPGANGKAMLGSLGTDAFPRQAKLVSVADAKLPRLTKGEAYDTMILVQQMSQKANIAKNKARVEKDKEKKKELRAEADKLEAEFDAKFPDLYRGVVKEHPATTAASEAANALLANSEKAKVTSEEAAALAKLIMKNAEPYGPRYAGPTTARLGEAILRQKGLEAVALLALEPAAKALKETDKLDQQYNTLYSYSLALEAAKRTDDLKSVSARLVKLDAALDKEYHETVPPFKAKAFGGREDQSRVAVLELFTGAQCPPCVASDVAFDALLQSYKTTDVVLLQYHMHIPGPDPLTNPSSLARWDYYSELFPSDIRGTPSTLFNGKPASGGGGPMSNAEPKFKDFVKQLDSDLKKTSTVKLAGTASRDGDKISIAVDVKGSEANENAKVRLLLVEDVIKYVGGNRIRFHHQVVRAMPGGPAGVALKDGKLTQTADVATIRAELVKYLDESAKERPFPYPKIRPLDLKDLKVVALVQDDKTGEILQATQFDVK